VAAVVEKHGIFCALYTTVDLAFGVNRASFAMSMTGPLILRYRSRDLSSVLLPA